MAVKIQFRRDTATNWESVNPILSQGELGLDTTNNRFKLGDGATAWNSLAYTVDFQPDGTYPNLRAQATTAADVGLGNVTNESKETMFTDPTFTGTVSGVTAEMVGLGNVTNETKETMFNNPTFTGTVSGVTKAHVGLENVTNDAQIPLSQKGQANGVAELNGEGLVPASQLPSYVDDVLEFADQASFPAEGVTGKIYVALDVNKTYRWSGSAYVEISASLVPNDGTLTVEGSNGLSGSGTFTADQATNETITLSHADTSSQGNVDNSANDNFVKSMTFDEYGHVTGVTSGEVVVPVTSVNGETGDVTITIPDPTIIATDTPPENPVDGQVWVPKSNYEVQKNLWTFTGHTASVQDVAVSTDGQYLYSGSWDRKVKQINASDGSEGWTFDTVTDPVHAVAVTTDGQYVFCGGEGNDTVRQIDASDGSAGWTFTNHTGTIRSIVVSPDGQYVYSGGTDNDFSNGTALVRQIDASDGSAGWTFRTADPFSSDVTWAIEISPNGQYLYVGGEDKVRQIDASNGNIGWTFTGFSNDVDSLAVSPDGEYVYGGGANRTVKQINASNGGSGWTFTNFSSDVLGIAVSPDGEYVYAGSRNGILKQINASDGSEGWTFNHGDDIRDVAVSIGGRYVYSSGDDNTIKQINASDATRVDQPTYEKFQNMVYNSSTSQWEGTKII
jgi:WD40 repeat protein